jgi:hypothetical protein
LNQHERPTVDPYYFGDLRLIYGATALPLDNKQTVGLSTHYLGYSEYEVYAQDGTLLGTYHPLEYALGISYGRRLIKPLGIGITIKYLHDFLYPQWVADIYDLPSRNSVTSYAVDGGVLLIAPFGLSLGASLLNLGPDIEYSTETIVELPVTARVGVAQSLTELFKHINKQDEDDAFKKIARWFDLTITVEYKRDFRSEYGYNRTALGFETKLFNLLSYRQGFRLAGEQWSLANEPKSFGLDLGVAEFDVTVTNSDYPVGTWWIETKFSPLEAKPEFIQQNKTLDRIFLNLSCATIPGGGQLYNGDAWKGIPLVIASLLIADAILERDVRPDWEYTAALISLPILYIGSGIEANMAWRR